MLDSPITVPEDASLLPVLGSAYAAFAFLGWAPSFADCAVTGEPGPHRAFVPQLGGMVADHAAPAGALRIDLPTLELLSALLTGDWAHAEAAHQGIRTRASGAVAAYVQFHLERGLRSLEHVDRIAP